MKKILIFMAVVASVLCLSAAVHAEYDTQSATVYITVTDITDVDKPLNVLVERQELSVTNFDITKYGEQYSGMELIDGGVTYLHALMALHEQHFGAEQVKDKFKMDTENITRIFWGKSVASIMYKNGKYIFAYPNYITVKDGDEINVCLYNAGYSQAVASFDKAYVYASPNESIDLSLFEHYEFPRQQNPIENAEMTNERLLYILDDENNIIASDSNGQFQLKFSDAGEHQITIMPTYGYHLPEGGGTTLVWWEQEEVEKEVEHIIADENVTEIITTEDERYAEMVNAFDGAPAVVIDWGVAENATQSVSVPFGNSGIVYNYDLTHTITVPEWVLELVRKEQFVPGEATMMVEHTTPWVIINVSDELLFASTKIDNNKVTARLKNTENYSGNLMCAAYTYNGDGLKLEDVKKQSIKEFATFSFDSSKTYDVFKIFAWDGTMHPITEAYIIDPALVTGVDWNYSMPKPQNMIISGK